MNKMFQGLSIYDFQKQFGDEISCIDALVNLKWPDGYICRYCSYQNYCLTRRYGERRCCSCKKPESATAQTLFHKIKFPLHKAFMMMYLICTTKKGISALELHRKMGVHKRTALLFKRKVMAAMAPNCKYKMNGLVEIDKTYIYSWSGRRKNTSSIRAKLIVVGIERCGRGISRAYARHIKHAGVKQLKPFFAEHIYRCATIQTRTCRNYSSLKKEYPYIIRIKSGSKKNFPVLKRYTWNLKAWFKGIFGSVRDLQAYLDEYNFKFNRHKMKGDIFNELLGRMLNHPPRTYGQIFSVD